MIPNDSIKEFKKEDRTDRYKTYTRGDYVLSPCKNAFNNKVSFWISKKDYTLAFYAFTPTSYKENIEKHFDDAIRIFDAQYTRIYGNKAC